MIWVEGSERDQTEHLSQYWLILTSSFLLLEKYLNTSGEFLQFETLMLIKQFQLSQFSIAKMKNAQFQRESTFNWLGGDAITGGFRPTSPAFWASGLINFDRKILTASFSQTDTKMS